MADRTGSLWARAVVDSRDGAGDAERRRYMERDVSLKRRPRGVNGGMIVF